MKRDDMVRLSCWMTLFTLALAGIGVAQGQETVTVVSSAMPSVTVTAPASVPVDATEVWSAVSDQDLDEMRGGFDGGHGLMASFGIARVVYINGNLVSSTSVNIPDVGRMDAAQASALASVLGTVNLIQNGPDNTFAPGMLNHTIAATVIQNTLNQQNIQSLTTINTSVNTLNELRNINLANSLQAALIGSLGH